MDKCLVEQFYIDVLGEYTPYDFERGCFASATTQELLNSLDTHSLKKLEHYLVTEGNHILSRHSIIRIFVDTMGVSEDSLINWPKNTLLADIEFRRQQIKYMNGTH